MILKEPRLSAVPFDVPGKYDWDLSLFPRSVTFTPNVEDATVLSVQGEEVFPVKKSRVGFWHAPESTDVEPGDLHTVRFLPGFCESRITPTNDDVHVYPIPLYQGGIYVATLFIVVSGSKVALVMHDTYEASDVGVLSEQLRSEVDATGGTLLWVRDERNSSVCVFPESTLDFSADILLQVLGKLPKYYHIDTESERRAALLRRRNLFIYLGVLSAVVISAVFALDRVKDTNARKIAALEAREQSLTQSLAIQQREGLAVDLLRTTLTNQPDWSDVISRLYAGTTALSGRTVVAHLDILKGKSRLHYVVSGNAFEKITDVRPLIQDKFLKLGLAISEPPVVIPGSDLVPHVLVSGVMTLETNPEGSR